MKKCLLVAILAATFATPALLQPRGISATTAKNVRSLRRSTKAAIGIRWPYIPHGRPPRKPSKKPTSAKILIPEAS